MELIKQGKILVFECPHCGCRFKAFPCKDYIYSDYLRKFKTKCFGCDAILTDESIAEVIEGEEITNEKKPNKSFFDFLFGGKE